MALLLLEISAVFYVLASVLGIVQLVWPRESGDRSVLIGFAVALLSHAIALGGRTVEISAFPMANLHDGLSLLAFIAAVVAVWIAAKSGVPQVAPLAGVLVATLVIISVLIEPAESVPEALRSPWLPIHISLAFLGDALFAVAGVVAVVYLIHERRLKGKKAKIKSRGTGLHKLPALEILDKVSVRLIEIGFPIMTLGLISGALYGSQVWGTYWRWDPRNMVSLAVWILYALLLHFRLTIGWRGRKAAILTVVGVLVTLVAFVGMGLAGVGAHGKDYVS